jgi:hypothetical protein
MKMKLKRGEAIDLCNAIAAAKEVQRYADESVFFGRLQKLNARLHKHVKKIERRAVRRGLGR